MDIYFVNLTKKYFDIIEQRNLPIKPNLLIPMNMMTPKVNLFIDYLRNKKLIGKLALDSGTFSLQKKKDTNINHAFYRFLEYTKANSHKFDIIFNFDIAFTPEGFDLNYEYLMKLYDEGIDAWPVGHDLIGKDYEVLVNSLNHKKIALGQDENRSFENILYADIRMIKFGVERVHLLGVATPQMLYYIPATSADASSAIQYAFRGIIKFFDVDSKNDIYGFTLKLPKLHDDDPNTEKFIFLKEKLIKWLKYKNINIAWNDLRKKGWQYYAGLINIAYFIQVEEIANQRHKEIRDFLFN